MIFKRFIISDIKLIFLFAASDVIFIFNQLNNSFSIGIIKIINNQSGFDLEYFMFEIFYFNLYFIFYINAYEIHKLFM